MRFSSRWLRPVLPACLALCIFVFSVATSSAHSVSAPFNYVDHAHNFGLHGSLKKRAGGISPTTTTSPRPTATTPPTN